MGQHDGAGMGSPARTILVTNGKTFPPKERISIKHLRLLVIAHRRNLLTLGRRKHYCDCWLSIINEKQNRPAKHDCDRLAVHCRWIKSAMIESELDRDPKVSFSLAVQSRNMSWLSGRSDFAVKLDRTLCFFGFFLCRIMQLHGERIGILSTVAGCMAPDALNRPKKTRN
jgi:hypothetical protein